MCFRIKGRGNTLQYYYSLYCMGYALYLLFVITATEWFMGYRFLTYGYVTFVNQVRKFKKNVASFIICIQVFHLLFELVVLSKLRVEKSKVTKYQMKYFYDGYFSKDCLQTAEICCFVISSSEEEAV